MKEAHHKANHLFMKQFNLSIPTPCHERWEQMTPTEQGRFCSSCQKTVIDFTHMTDQQLAAFFKKPVGNVCGRLAKDQLERDIIIPPKRIPWVRYFFQFTLPAFLLSLKSAGQKDARVEKITVVHNNSDTLIKDVKQQATALKTISGQVRDAEGTPIPFATAMIKGTSHSVSCDGEGKFTLPYQQLPFTLYISSVGYESISYQVAASTPNEIILPAMQTALTGEVVIIAGYVVPKKKQAPLISVPKT